MVAQQEILREMSSRRTPIQLWQENVGVAKDLARRYARSFRPILGDCSADLEQAALLGLWQASIRYDERWGVKFSSFAWDYVRGEILSERKRMSFWGFNAERARIQKKIPTLPQRASFSTIEESELAIDETTIEMFAHRDLLDFMIKQLRPVKAQVVARRFWLEGLSLPTIAHQMALSRDRIEQLSAKARRDLIALGKTMWAKWEGESMKEKVG